MQRGIKKGISKVQMTKQPTRQVWSKKKWVTMQILNNFAPKLQLQNAKKKTSQILTRGK